MKRILIVDDEEKIREIYTKLLIDEGYDAVGVPGAADANDVLKNKEIDLILLDIKMPEVEGNILYGVIQLFHRKIKVIVISVYNLDEQRQVIPDAADYYDKSQGIDILLTKIKKVLEDWPIKKEDKIGEDDYL